MKHLLIPQRQIRKQVISLVMGRGGEETNRMEAESYVKFWILRYRKVSLGDSGVAKTKCRGRRRNLTKLEGID